MINLDTWFRWRDIERYHDTKIVSSSLLQPAAKHINIDAWCV